MEPGRLTSTVAATLRAASALMLADVLNGIAFGAFAAVAGLSLGAAVAMSATAFSAGGQAVAVAGFAGHQPLVMALTSAAALNLRFLVIGTMVLPRLDGPRWRRALHLLFLTDASWAIADRVGAPAGRFGAALVTAGGSQLSAWTTGTALGASGVLVVGIDPQALGLDVVLALLFVWLVLAMPATRLVRTVACAAAALLLVPMVLPPVYAVVGAGALAAAWERMRP